MMSLFHPPDCDAVRCRFAELHPGGPRLWGRMDAAQMLAHCAKGLEAATTDRPVRQAFLGRLVSPLIRPLVLGDRPFRRNAPTSPLFVVAEPRDFEAEMRRLAHLIDRFVQRGPARAAQVPHVFFGRLSGDQWGRLMYKHLDHHLRQFGV
ncbi:hypothetical protein GETHPA_29120 [Geothrix rubra]|uniref:DUF1569 domain-containing protein n=1 Tax=Geothrix rubra TaxID=2927977 RepID=A0ABQ5Q9L8_9BACT|nr:DUF1569 domain-containing protein [Geothrix rubra]GLH71378.1 hypothetical protein GETHPA_29120 [Geothrix rubra]